MAEPISIQQLKNASEDATSLGEVVNGDENSVVTTRLGETYPSVKKAIKTLFENGGLPATPFKTKALMTASALVDDDYAQVTDDTVNNGLYVKEAGAWVKSEYDPLTQAKADATTKANAVITAMSAVVGTNSDNSIVHGFVDAESKLVAYFDGNGEFDFYPTEATKDRLSKVSEAIAAAAIDATTKANTAKSEAIAAAATDATTKADTAIITAGNNASAALSAVVGTNTDKAIIHGFVDADSKLVAYIDGNGELDFYPTAATKDRLSKESKVSEDANSIYSHLFLDAEDKIIGGWDKYGNDLVVANDVEPSNNLNAAPLTHDKSSVRIADFSRIIEKMDVKTTAKGRTTDPDVELNGDGYTHPKLVYEPAGWNGYKYWMAATPTFGITPSDAYENPHVWCSNDMITWIEPTGAPLDLPDPNTSSGYWSDTHLVIDDDGWMYCIYRGNYFYGYGSSFIVAKKTRDGLNWSDRIVIYDPAVGGVNNGILSPAIYKNGSKWQYIDILQDKGDLTYTSGYGRGIFRRSADNILGDYGTYTTDHLVNLDSRPWGETRAPWHIDAIKVGNLYLLLIAVGAATASYANELYLAWSSDGWNYDVFERLDTLYFNAYRSSISLREVVGNKIHLDVIVSRTTGFNGGNLDLFNLTLETK